jgi:pre-60S factor REI1
MEDTNAKENGGVKLGDGHSPSEEDKDGWETSSSFSSLDTDELTSVPIDDRSSSYQRLPLHKHHSNADPRPHRTADGWHSHAHQHTNAVYYDEHEMHLPSGRIAGHRSLRKYYRQNLHSYPTAAERMERAQRLIEEANSEDAEMQDGETNNDVPATQPRNSLMRRGEAGMLGVTAQQRKDVRSQEIRSKQNEQRAQSRYLARLEKQNNFQKHFRVSVFNDVFAEGLFANFCAFRILCFSEWSLSVVLVDMQASRLWKASLFLWA